MEVQVRSLAQCTVATAVVWVIAMARELSYAADVAIKLKKRKERNSESWLGPDLVNKLYLAVIPRFMCKCTFEKRQELPTCTRRFSHPQAFA